VDDGDNAAGNTWAVFKSINAEDFSIILGISLAAYYSNLFELLQMKIELLGLLIHNQMNNIILNSIVSCKLICILDEL